MDAFLISFWVIFVAELGDKSQLMVLAFATRFPTLSLLAVITVATALVHAASVLVGAVLAEQIPTGVMNLLAGLAFFGFAAWTLRGDHLSEEEETRAERSSGSALAAVGTAFLLAELGDKTMLATITLATTNGPVGTWAGSTLGMVAADALAIGAGRLLGRNLPERTIRIAAAVAFVVFGALLVAQGVGEL